MFPTQLRSSSAAISYNLSVAIFGGLTPAILTSFVAHTNDVFMPAYYIIFAALVSVVPTLLIRETARQSIKVIQSSLIEPIKARLPT
jgi:MHS family proline/betaine transporter-like MFS transporter